MNKKREEDKVVRRNIGLLAGEWLEIDAQVKKRKLKGRSGWIREKLYTGTFRK